MNLLQQPYIAIRAYYDAVLLMFRTFMWLNFLVPLVLGIGMYFGGEVLMDNFKELDLSGLNEEDGSEFLLVGLQAILIYMMYHMNKYVVLTLMTPILTPLSERTEYHLTGNKYPLIFKYYVEDVVRAFKIILRNMLLQMVWMGVIYTITFIYGLPGWVNDTLYYLIAFYFYGFSFMDYANERRRISISDAIKFTRKNALVAFCLGGIYVGLYYIPYAGVVIAPILSVVAGTVAVHYIIDLSDNPYAVKEGESTEDYKRRENTEQVVEVEVETEEDSE